SRDPGAAPGRHRQARPRGPGGGDARPRGAGRRADAAGVPPRPARASLRAGGPRWRARDRRGHGRREAGSRGGGGAGLAAQPQDHDAARPRAGRAAPRAGAAAVSATAARPAAPRVGTGFDAHRLVAGRPLVLGGVRIEHPRGLEGHSDGDCLLHAICDALLAALPAGDMGRRFPSTDPRWKDASSATFLQAAARLVAQSGYVVGNVDATVIAQAPALAPHLEAMRTRVAESLGLALEA